MQDYANYREGYDKEAENRDMRGAEGIVRVREGEGENGRVRHASHGPMQ